MNSEILDRLPPQDLQAEKGILGSILCAERVLDDIDLEPGEFYAEANQKLYTHMRGMYQAGTPIDPLVLMDRLKAAGDFEAIGGAAYLAEVAQSVPYAFNAKHYAGIIREKARRRSMIHAATELLRDAWDQYTAPEDILDAAERTLTGIRTNDSTRSIVDAQEATVRAMDVIDKAYRGEQLPRLPTGMARFDEEFGGIVGLTVLAARLGVGKTALACQWADYTASRGRLTYFASLEMSAAEIAVRLLCSLSAVDSKRIDTGNLSDRDLQDLAAVSREFSARALRFDERPRLRVSDIRREARRMVKDGLKLIVVDYLQFITPEDRRIPREQQVSEISKDLKALSRELNVPVLALAQINRQATQGTAPGPEHIRESDAVGQNADMVITITTEDEPISHGIYEGMLRIGKNRNGPKGKLRVDWQPARTRFTVHETPVSEMDNYEPAFSGDF